MTIAPIFAVQYGSSTGRHPMLLEKYISDVHAGEGWRMLVLNESIAYGDEYLMPLEHWKPVDPSWVNSIITPASRLIRRKMKWECGHRFLPPPPGEAASFCPVCSALYGKRVEVLR